MNAKKSTMAVNQPDPKSVQLGHRDSLKSYTPQIRYTKLEFKVSYFYFFCSVMLALRTVAPFSSVDMHWFLSMLVSI